MGISVAWIVLFSFVLAAECNLIKATPRVHYTSEWAVHLHDGLADPSFLQEKGCEIIGKVGTFDDVYLVRHTETHARHARSAELRLIASEDVTDMLSSHSHVRWAEQQSLTKKHTRSQAFSDPIFVDQWHLVNTGQFSGKAGVDVNIQSAWDMGYNGVGVRIAVVDDGFQLTHPDLAAHYQASSSFCFNTPIGAGNTPAPNVTEDFHGTSAAGVALAANNSVCGVGAAFMAEGAGIRLIAEPTTDATDASALTYMNQVNDIYSNSWGPADDGVNVGGPGKVGKKALQTGVATGRGNLGSIYVWAAGNGGDVGDNCNYDGYANARETIAVGAIGNDGIQSYYSEPCAALLVVAPSSSANDQAGIRTTDLLNANGYDPTSCTSTFGGTSSACPLVSGITALMLQANPSLSWRDVQFVLATTAFKTDSTDADWVKNSAGYFVNHKYGFGLVDATAAVLASRTHTTLPAQQNLTSGTITVNKAVPDFPGTGIKKTFTVSDNIVIEQVVINVVIDHSTSGDLQIVLTAPSGTKSSLATPHGTTPAISVKNQLYALGLSSFGSQLTSTPLQGPIAIASPKGTCTSFTNCAALSGAVAFIYPGGSGCYFTTQAKQAQTCGAIAFILVNTDTENPDDPVDMGGSDDSITIPCGSVSYNLGRTQTSGTQASLYITQYSANSYKSGWDFSSNRMLGESSKGTWTIEVTDGITRNTGTFKTFAVTVYGYAGSAPANPDPIDSGTPLMAIPLAIILAVATAVCL